MCKNGLMAKSDLKRPLFIIIVLTYVVRIYLLNISDLLTFYWLLLLYENSLEFNIPQSLFHFEKFIIKLRVKFPSFEVPNCSKSLVTFTLVFTKPFGLMQIAKLSTEFLQEIPQNHASQLVDIFPKPL